MRIDIREKLCRNFCEYYKPSKDEGLACKGFQIVDKLTEEGLEISFKKSGRKIKRDTEEALILNMCKSCSFYENDCDFVMKKAVYLPCGGFIFLGQLIEMDIIGIDDIIKLKNKH